MFKSQICPIWCVSGALSGQCNLFVWLWLWFLHVSLHSFPSYQTPRPFRHSINQVAWLDTTWTWLATNGTNQNIFNISFQYILAQQVFINLKKHRFLPFGANRIQFGSGRWSLQSKLFIVYLTCENPDCAWCHSSKYPHIYSIIVKSGLRSTLHASTTNKMLPFLNPKSDWSVWYKRLIFRSCQNVFCADSETKINFHKTFTDQTRFPIIWLYFDNIRYDPTFRFSIVNWNDKKMKTLRHIHKYYNFGFVKKNCTGPCGVLVCQITNSLATLRVMLALLLCRIVL